MGELFLSFEMNMQLLRDAISTVAPPRSQNFIGMVKSNHHGRMEEMLKKMDIVGVDVAYELLARLYPTQLVAEKLHRHVFVEFR